MVNADRDVANQDCAGVEDGGGVSSNCDRDPPGQCLGTTWEAATYPPLGRAIRSPQVFNHVEVVIWISREDAASKHLKLNLTYLDQ